MSVFQGQCISPCRNVTDPFKSSRIDLEQHQLLCEKLVTEAMNSEDRLHGIYHLTTQYFTSTWFRHHWKFAEQAFFFDQSLLHRGGGANAGHSDARPLLQRSFCSIHQISTSLKIVIMLGDSNTGKTSIVHRYTRDEFLNHEPTIDISYKMKAQLTARGLISIQIWDTAGQERFRSMPKCYFRKGMWRRRVWIFKCGWLADGVLMTYDVTRQASLLNIRNWLSDLDEMTQVVVVGNKCDLIKGKSRLATGSWTTIDGSERRVTKEHGQKMARELNAHHIEVSARTGHNIPQAFEVSLRRAVGLTQPLNLATVANNAGKGGCPACQSDAVKHKNSTGVWSCLWRKGQMLLAK